MNSYFLLPSVQCVYFRESETIYQMKGSRPVFGNPIHLSDAPELWIKRLSKEDKKLLEKDLKKYESN